MRAVDGKSVDPAEKVEFLRDHWIVHSQLLGSVRSLMASVKVSKQMGVVGFFDCQYEMIAQPFEEQDIWAVGADGVLSYDDLEMWMFLAKFGEQSPAGVDLTVVFGIRPAAR